MSAGASLARFGALADGRAVDACTLTNRQGLSARILSLGGIIQSVLTPDYDGALGDIALGFPDLAGYLDDPFHFGALIGRYAGRIAGAAITIEGERHSLSVNEGANTLHGGARGFDRAVWAVDAPEADTPRLRLTHLSPDGDQGFPGALSVAAVYELTDDNALRIDFTATTTRATPISLTNHGYWNLSGDPTRTIRDHRLRIEAKAMTPVDAALIPTGDIRPVAGTAFDFRKARRLGDVIDDADPRIVATHGLDHSFVLSPPADGRLRRAARLTDPASGRSLELWTTEPCLQVYTGNGLGDGPPGNSGAPCPRWAGVALETQQFPNAPNCPAFPQRLLCPGQTWRSTTLFHFTPPTPHPGGAAAAR